MQLLDEGADFTVCQLFINGKLECVTLQDDDDPVKVPGETRIPAGRYEVKLQTWGEFHKRYLERFGIEFHFGMLHVLNVPNYEGILFHIGNSPKDTRGCILTGVQQSHTERNRIQGSEIAYRHFYPPVARALRTGERVFLTIDYARAA